MPHRLSLQPIVDLQGPSISGYAVRPAPDADLTSEGWLEALVEGLPGLLPTGILHVQAPLAWLEGEGRELEGLLRVIPASRLVLDVPDTEGIESPVRLAALIGRSHGLSVKVGFQDGDMARLGLECLASAPPDFLRLDPELVQGCRLHPIQRALLGAVLEICQDLGVIPLGDTLEDAGDARWLELAGVRLQSGPVFTEPGLDEIPQLAPERLTALALSHPGVGGMRLGA